MSCVAAAGIDAGKFYLDVAFVPQTETFRVENSTSGIRTILKHLARAKIGRVVLEAIGCYAQPLVRALTAKGIVVGIVNPRRIKAFRDAEGKRAKNDRIDALLIARFALVMTDAIRPLPSEHQLALKALATRLRQLIEMTAMEKTRLKQATNDTIAQSHRDTIALLNQQRKTIETELDTHLDCDPELKRRRGIYESIPGIGKRVSTVLATDMPELGTLDRRASASLAGLAPHIHQSGAGAGRAQIGGGRPCVRAALYMAALSAVRADPAFKRTYQDMRAKGKPAKIALIAVARKIITIANALTKTGQHFSPKNPNPA